MATRIIIKELQKKVDKTFEIAFRLGEVRDLPKFLNQADRILKGNHLEHSDDAIRALLEEMDTYTEYMRHPDYFRQYPQLAA